jgi:hypothetical protein
MTAPPNERFYIPGTATAMAVKSTLGEDRVEDRRKRSFVLNAFVSNRNRWLLSIRGNPEVRMQCLIDSNLPAKIASLGYSIEQTGAAERILHHAIVEKLVNGPDGTMVPLTEGSTRPVVEVEVMPAWHRSRSGAFGLLSPALSAKRIATNAVNAIDKALDVLAKNKALHFGIQQWSDLN